MSLTQVLTRDSLHHQASTTTPFAFFGSSFHDSKDSPDVPEVFSTYFSSRGSSLPPPRSSPEAPEHAPSEQLLATGAAPAPSTADDLRLSSSSTTMNTLHHVAQQSRREKLRIPGSLQPASPPSSNHSGEQQLDQLRPQSSGELHHHQDPGLNPDMLSLYGAQLLPPEVYSYSGSELLNAVSGKTTGYLEGLPPGGTLVNPVYAPQTGFISKAGSWPGGGSLTAQLGSFAPNSSSASLLVGTGAFGSTTGRDLGSYFSGSGAGNAQEAMQLYLMNAAGFAAAFPDGATAAAPAGSMVFIPGAAPGSGSAQSLLNAGVGSTYPASWKSGDELVFMPASDRAKPFPGSQVEGGLDHQFAALQQQQNGGSSQLSLSLSSQQHGYGVLQQQQSSGLEAGDGKRGGKLGADLSHFRRDFQGKVDGSPGVAGAASGSAMSASFNIISSSRYLKACQQLLEEVCSVGKGANPASSRRNNSSAGPSPLTSPTSAATNNNNATSCSRDVPSANEDQQGGDQPEAREGNNSVATASTGGAAATNSTADAQPGESTSVEEKQELEGKKTKLINMLQEVDRRYRQYYDQMQVVISSFDAVAGVGAATPYTALALQAMSRYFRCLKDAITGQISIVCKTLGEKDISKQITSKSPTSRLRFIDQQIRQQRAFQQLGMLNQHAWRPQRGLPERSVSILRAWLFEHFLHPYPKDADKMMLARQTGLTRSQVSNWFINARVRLWKPMVEEMYQDETREHELDVSRLHAAAAAAAAAADSDPDLGSHAALSAGELNDPSKSKLSDSSDHFVQQHDHQPASSNSPGEQHYAISGAAAGLRKQTDATQLYDDSEHHHQLKKSRYSTDADHLLSTSHHHMELDLKPEQEMHHQLANGAALHFGYDQQQLRFANSAAAAAAAAGFRYNVNPGGGGGVSLTLGLQHSDGLNSPQAYLQHGGAAAAAAAAAGFHLKNSGPGTGGGAATEHDFSSLYENAAAAGLHEGMSYASRKHMESQLLHDFVPS